MTPHPKAGETVKALLVDTGLNEKFHNGHRRTEIVHKQNKDGRRIFDIQFVLLKFWHTVILLQFTQYLKIWFFIFSYFTFYSFQSESQQKFIHHHSIKYNSRVTLLELNMISGWTLILSNRWSNFHFWSVCFPHVPEKVYYYVSIYKKVLHVFISTV